MQIVLLNTDADWYESVKMRVESSTVPSFVAVLFPLILVQFARSPFQVFLGSPEEGISAMRDAGVEAREANPQLIGEAKNTPLKGLHH